MPKDHLKEIAPDQFVQKGFVQRGCLSRELTYGDGPKAQVNAQAAGSFNSGEIPLLVILLNDALVRSNQRKGGGRFFKPNGALNEGRGLADCW